MDAQRFDHLTRMIARRTSRRTLLRGAGTGAVLTILARSSIQPARAADCAEGQVDCGGVCIDTCCNNANCGGCGIVCTSGETCFEGICGCPSGLCCAEGETICNGACVDLTTDLNNCGACGSICESGLVAVDCRAGECVRADCPPDLTYCGAVALCRDLATDPEHCGACGNVCAAGLTCFEAVCDCPSGLCCAAGQTQCGDVCVETCCDNANCGACGHVCGAGETCFEGVCDCPSGTCGTTGDTVTLPSTGSGPTPSTGRPEALVLVGAGAALAAAGWRRLIGRPTEG